MPDAEPKELGRTGGRLRIAQSSTEALPRFLPVPAACWTRPGTHPHHARPAPATAHPPGQAVGHRRRVLISCAIALIATLWKRRPTQGSGLSKITDLLRGKPGLARAVPNGFTQYCDPGRLRPAGSRLPAPAGVVHGHRTVLAGVGTNRRSRDPAAPRLQPRPGVDEPALLLPRMPHFPSRRPSQRGSRSTGGLDSRAVRLRTRDHQVQRLWR